MHPIVVIVFNAIEATCGWSAFNRMCEDAPDLSTREKRLALLTKTIGSNRILEFQQKNDFELVLSGWTRVEKDSFFSILYGRLSSSIPNISYPDFLIFIKAMTNS